jgi:isochorismate synthase
VTSSRDRTWLTLNLIVEPGSDSNRLTQSAAELAERLLEPAPMNFESSSFADEPVYSGNDDDFKSLVCDAVSEIERGNFDKVVLARAVRAECEREIDAFSVLRNLREVHRSAFVFGLWSEEKVFVGASPELLARQQGREVRARSLAGTIERGKSPEDDAAKARSLETSVKDRAEHAAVRDTLYEALSKTCDDVVAPDEPVILSLNNVHHLHTPLSAQLKEGASFSGLVEKLHPTPAVGGSPRDAALRFIRDNEGLDRGWYAAPVGWISAGSGEFAVALRSALIDGNRATLFAGCGIVMDSDPDMEVEESNLKLQTMKSALAVSMAAKPREAFESTAASRGAK